MASTTHAHTHAPVDPLAPEETLRAPTEPTRPSLVRAIFAAAALLFFMAPAVVILVGGAGGPLAREQRAKAPRPSQGWHFFDTATRYLTQELPWRNHAVNANTWIGNNIFGEAPRYGTAALAGPDRALPFGGVNQQAENRGYAKTGGAKANHPIVAQGLDGWYYLQGEIDTACQPPVAFDVAVRRWDEFIRDIRASGRNVVLDIVPEKSTIYPEHVSPKTVWWRCAWRQKQRLWPQIEAMRNPDVFPLRQPLLAMKRRDPSQLLYLPLDSHWNEVGVLDMVRRSLAHVGGGVRVRPDEVRSGTKPYQGDVASLAGAANKKGTEPSRTIVRTSDRVIPGPTLFLHDSYGDPAIAMLRPYAQNFNALTFISVNPLQVVQRIQQARTVIIETVERDFLNRAAIGTEQEILSPRFLAALPKALGPPPPP
jgi:alginate O-acetyltransferase complex protein AlgJ